VTYELEFHPQALKEWKKLDGSVKPHLKSKLERRLKEPHIAKASLRGFANCYKIKHETYRLIYEVDDERSIVFVLAVGARDKLAAYKAADDRYEAE
jgi:mRNA interferase RelE/StbE